MEQVADESTEESFDSMCVGVGGYMCACVRAHNQRDCLNGFDVS